MISEEAVEAAAKAVYVSYEPYLSKVVDWDDMTEEEKEQYRRDTRAALAAAEPLMHEDRLTWESVETAEYVRELRAENARKDSVVEAVRRLLADPPYHDCKGPTCRLCSIDSVLGDLDAL